MSRRPGALLKISAVLLLCVFLPPRARATEDRCAVPEDLKKVVAAKYPGASVVGLADLSDGDRKKFKNDHGDDCPGFARVDFYGDGAPTFSIALQDRDRNGPVVRLVLAHRRGARWSVLMLDKANGSGGVIWSERAGEYEDVYGANHIHATHPVIMFCGYSSWAVVYAWVNGKVAKVQLQD